MGKNNQQRRAAKKRLRERQVRGTAWSGSGSGSGSGSAKGAGGFGSGHGAGGFGASGNGWPSDGGLWGDALFGDDDLHDDEAFGGDESGTGWSSGAGPGTGWPDGAGPRDARSAGRGPGRDDRSNADVAGLFVTGASAVTAGAEAIVEQVVAALISADQAGEQSTDRGAAGRMAAERLMTLVGERYESGWQPADLMHVARRGLTAHGVRLVAAVIVRQSAENPTAGYAPDQWLAQLADVAAEIGVGRAAGPAVPMSASGPSVTEWLRADGQNAWDAWRDVLGLVALLFGLPGLQVLADPPSKWRASRQHRGASAGAASGTNGASAGRSRPAERGNDGSGAGLGSGAGVDTERRAKMLGRIRALLAKAEATAFPEEAEAFSAKAQELMSRYSIDEAVLQSHDGHIGRPEVRARRFHVDNPYASTKVQLLAAVGRANRTRVIWMSNVGMATAVGDPFDLDLVDMLFTSLLVQATRAVTEAGRLGQAARSASFRRAFLLAYAQRIGERLEQADVQTVAASGAQLVLASRAEAVDEEFDRLFPHTTAMRTRRVNAHGWHAGRAAADHAVIAHGQLASEG